MRARDIELDDVITVQAPTTRQEVVDALERAGANGWVMLLDEAGRPQRWLNSGALDEIESLEHAGLPVRVTVEPEDTLRDALEKMLQSAVGTACCVDPRGTYRGVVRVETLIQIIQELQLRERDRQAAIQ
jgi:osmoprotectant transport system ATP-binding protein